MSVVAPQLVEEQGQLLLGVDPEFAKCHGQVVPDGGLSDEQLPSDLRHPVAGQEQPDDLCLPV